MHYDSMSTNPYKKKSHTLGKESLQAVDVPQMKEEPSHEQQTSTNSPPQL